MSDRKDSLSLPKRTNTGDPGAHDLESSESDDHFSDAQSAPSESHRNSPIPKTRVEKVSDEPSYGEVPGTEAYKKREGDAEPDEIAIIPDKPPQPPQEDGAKSPTPGGHPIPKTVVEETEDSAGSETHGEKKHRSDPPPDLVLKAGGKAESATDSPISPALKTPQTARSRRSPHPFSPGPRSADFDGGDEADDDFGDDFDDFEEGAEADDFGEFDDGFQVPIAPAVASPPPQPPPPAVQPLSFPIPDFEGLDADEILSTTEPYLNAIFPTDDDDLPVLPPLSKDHPIFLSQRSASLWSQLVAPPPLQPPDWIRSRIRRLFLVSLGVPVDLDEILPASKQKKLVLPSLNLHAASPRTSTDSRRGGGHVSRLRERDGDNASTTSLDSQGKPRESSARRGASSKRRGPPAAPDLDLVAAKQLCTTTDEALDGMTDEELRAHVARLEAMESAADELLEYWRKRTDEKVGDRDAFEGVIENLVKHARKTRK